jgi:hypothetical protein
MSTSEGRRTALYRIGLGVAGVVALIFAILLLAYPAPFTSAKNSSQTTTARPANTVKTVVENSNQSPSDSLIGGIAGIGAALLLVAAFLPRITAVKAFGAEIALTPLSDTDKQRIAEQTEQVTEKIKSDKPVVAGKLTDDELQDLVRAVLLVGVDAGEAARLTKVVGVSAAAPAGEKLKPTMAPGAPSPVEVVLSNEAAAAAVSDAVSKRLG